MIKNIIFDFDGTIADSSKIMVSIVNSLSKKYDYKFSDPITLSTVRKLGTNKFLSKLGIESNLIPQFLNDILIGLTNNLSSTKAIVGIPKLMRFSKKRHFKFGIVTTNKKDNIIKFLKKINISVDFIYDEAGFLGKSDSLEKAVIEQKLKINETIYIGDEGRDIQSAKKIGIKSAAVTWGLTSKEVLLLTNPDYIFTKPENITNIFIK